MKIFLDMDDVVADWMSVAKAAVGRDWEYGERIPEHDWAKVKANKRMYHDLPLKEGAPELVAYCRNLLTEGKISGLYFLTALPHDYSMPYAAQDKVYWANEYFAGIPVFFGPFSHDKWRYCREGDILIDDRHANCSDWRAQGGLAHEYRNWNNCKVWLESVL